MTLADLTVSLYFAGLVAFIPNELEKPTAMTVYLVKATVGTCAHAQILWFAKVGPSCPVACKKSDDARLCGCELKDDDILFDPKPVAHEGDLYDLQPPHEPLPHAGTHLNDFYYVVRLSDIEVNSVKAKSWERIVDMVGARVPSFGWQSAESCVLDHGGGDPAVPTAYDFTFVDSQHRQSPRHHRQALSKAAKLTLKISDRGYKKFKLLIRRQRKIGSEVPIEIDCRNGCPPIYIMNNPVDVHCDEGMLEGRHFAAYDSISESVGNLIPRSLFDDADSFVDDGPQCPELGPFIGVLTLNGKPICPMTMIDPG